MAEKLRPFDDKRSPFYRLPISCGWQVDEETGKLIPEEEIKDGLERLVRDFHLNVQGRLAPLAVDKGEEHIRQARELISHSVVRQLSAQLFSEAPLEEKAALLEVAHLVIAETLNCVQLVEDRSDRADNRAFTKSQEPPGPVVYV